jgi:F-actin capping protein, beta subunit
LCRYYDGIGVLSCYVWESEEGERATLNACVAVKKELEKNKVMERGSWDSVVIMKIFPSKDESKTIFEVYSSATMETVLKRSDGLYSLCGTVNQKVALK